MYGPGGLYGLLESERQVPHDNVLHDRFLRIKITATENRMSVESARVRGKE